MFLPELFTVGPTINCGTTTGYKKQLFATWENGW